MVRPAEVLPHSAGRFQSIAATLSNVRSREAAQIVELLRRRERLMGGVLQSVQFAEGTRMRGRLAVVLAHRLHGVAQEVVRTRGRAERDGVDASRAEDATRLRRNVRPD